MKHEDITSFAFSLGYVLSYDDCVEIIRTSNNDETIEDAVNDFLNAYER